MDLNNDGFEQTESGIPLGFRYNTVLEIPIDVRPVVSAKNLADYPKGPSGQKGPGGRQGRDRKTFWCLTCDTAVSKMTTTWCRQCEIDRNSAARRTTRAEAAGRPTTVTFPIEVVNELLRLTDEVINNISGATMEFDRVHMSGGAIDDLMLSTKDLAGYLSIQIAPQVRKARHRTVTAAEVRQRNT